MSSLTCISPYRYLSLIDNIKESICSITHLSDEYNRAIFSDIVDNIIKVFSGIQEHAKMDETYLLRFDASLGTHTPAIVGDSVPGEFAVSVRNLVAAPNLVGLRRDRGPWNACLVSVTPNAAVLCISCEFEVISVFYCGICDGVEREFRLALTSVTNADFEDRIVDQSKAIFDQINAHLARGGDRGVALNAIGRIRTAVQLNVRVYDAIKAFALIRKLHAIRPGAINRLLIWKTGNSFAPEEVFGQSSVPIYRIENEPRWRRSITLAESCAECFALLTRDSLIEVETEMQRFIRSLIYDAPRLKPIRIFVSFELEKRVWIEQFETLVLVAEKLLKSFDDVTYVVNGMTGGVDGGDLEYFNHIYRSERNLIERFKDKIVCLGVEHLYGLSTRQKAQKFIQTDYSITPLGNATVLPFFLGNAGYAYGNIQLVEIQETLVKQFNQIKVLPVEHIRSIKDDLSLMHYGWGLDDGSRLSYSIEPEMFSDWIVADIAERC